MIKGTKKKQRCNVRGRKEALKCAKWKRGEERERERESVEERGAHTLNAC